MFQKIILALSLAFVLSSCGAKIEEPKKHYSFAVAESGSIALAESAVATVRGENVAELSFRTSGRINDIFVRVGDNVKKGQLLATVDDREANISAVGFAGGASDLGNAEAAFRAISESMRSVAESRASVSVADVKASEIGKSLAESDLELANRNLENFRATLSGTALSTAERVVQAEQSLSLIKSQLVNTESLLSEQESTLCSSSLAALAGAFVVARSGRDFSDGIIGVTEENRHKNDAFENYL